jgi:recombination protein RecT
MENKPVQQNTLKSILSQESVKKRFEEILKSKASSFTANLAVMVNNNEMLKKCDTTSVISAAIIAASLDLSLDPNLGMAALVPFAGKAQFQIMYKGLIQLSIRTGQYSRIGVTEIYKGQLKSENPLTGEYEFDFSVKSDVIIGFAAYFKLSNGFEKTEYWSIDKTKAHGKKFSQTFKKDYGLWKDDFSSMGKKTVIKSLLNTWGVKSIEMQQAIKFDQSTIKTDETYQELEPEYIDNTQETENLILDPSHPEWNSAIEGLKKGSITLEQIKKKYELSPETEKLLSDGN